MKRNIKIIIAIIIGVVILGALSNFNYKQKIIREKTFPTVTLNQECNLKNFQMKILNIKKENEVQNKVGNIAAKGEFLILKLAIKNTSKKPVSFNQNTFSLVGENLDFGIDVDAFKAMGYLNDNERIYNDNNDYISNYHEIKEGEQKLTYVVFEVPKNLNIENLSLRINDEKQILFHS